MTADADSSTLLHIQQARTLRGVPPDVYSVPYSNLLDLLELRAAQTPERVFLTYYNDDSGESLQLTYRQLCDRVCSLAGFLSQQLGVQKGERVATVAFNHPDTVLVYLACWVLGAAAAPVNVGEDDQRISFILNNAGVRVAFVRDEYLARVRGWQAQVPGLQTLVRLNGAHDELPHLEQILSSGDPSFRPAEAADLEDECLLVYTSGTTGAPKGVQLIQYNLLVDAQAIAEWHQISTDDRLMCILPIHHVNGIVVTLMTPLLVGASVVLNRGFKASSFWRRLAEERIAIVSVVPTILQYLCEANEPIEGYDLRAFRHCICGAGTLSVTLAQRFEEQFGKRIVHGYGLSETTCYSCFLPVDLSPQEQRYWMREHGYPSIGVPLPVNEMAIHDPQGQALPDGERGEIVIRGPNVMIGYLQRPDANAETFKYNWFRSGDEGFLLRDAQGRPFFFITGRLKELINRGGVKYSPFEIEEVLLQIPGVRVGLAVAFENVWYGEEVGAYVVLEPGATLSAEQILAYCRARMPAAKAPKVVVFGSEVPVTATGKYQRLRLKELFTPWAEVQFKG